jgi:hypothetical protein
MTFTAHPMVHPFVVNQAPSVTPDKGLQLLTVVRKVKSLEPVQFKPRFGVFFFFPKRLRASAFKVVGALYLFESIQL